MGRGLWWSFGEPREERGELVADFYYQIGKHVELRLPWPTRRFADAGGLSIHVGVKGTKNRMAPRYYRQNRGNRPPPL
jgi:hypothetical protein